MSSRSRVIDLMGTAVVWIEGFVAIVLVVLGAWGAISLVVAVGNLVLKGVAFDFDRYIFVIDIALLIFIIVELFRIAVAYLRHEDVIPTVLEAGLVAIARKLVAFDTEAAASIVLMKGAGLSLLLLAVGITWYLLAKRDPRMLPSARGDADVPDAS